MEDPPSVNPLDKTQDISLADDVLEKLYQSYALKQKRPGLGCFLAASILFDLWAIFIHQGQSWENLGNLTIFFETHYTYTIIHTYIHITLHAKYQNTTIYFICFIQQ